MNHRQHLNLVLGRTGFGVTGVYSVNRLNISNLFYKSAAAASAATKRNAKKQEIPGFRRLAESSFFFQAFRSEHYGIIKGADMFAPFGEDGKLLFADGMGHTSVYDTASNFVHAMPMMTAPKGRLSLAFSIPRTEAHATSPAVCNSIDSNVKSESFIYRWVKGAHSESLYILDMARRCPAPFEALSFTSKGWVWRPVPTPPFFRVPRYKPRMDSCAVVDGNTIFVSPSGSQENGIGTYRFDTVTQEWDQAGDWLLPFFGRAENVSELGHWFGLSDCHPHHLCAVSSLDPPVVQHVWPDFDPPETWSLFDGCLVNLGSGRFCIVKFFRARDPSDYDAAGNIVAVFTGVEVVRREDDDQQARGGLKMIKHKSKCLTNLDIKHVL